MNGLHDSAIKKMNNCTICKSPVAVPYSEKKLCAACFLAQPSLRSPAQFLATNPVKPSAYVPQKPLF
jgi:hypothetical protein